MSGRKGLGPRFTEEQQAEILRAYGDGELTRMIAARFHCDVSYPGLLAKRRGFERRFNDAARRNMADAARRRAAGRMP